MKCFSLPLLLLIVGISPICASAAELIGFEKEDENEVSAATTAVEPPPVEPGPVEPGPVSAGPVSETRETPPDLKLSLESWIEDLGAEDYSRRQFATIQLNGQQSKALPLVIEVLRRSSGEQAERLFLFLSGIAADPYSFEGAKAIGAIAEIASERTTARARRAQKILSVIGEEQKQLTIKQLMEIRAEPRTGTFQIITTKMIVPNALVINSNFQGDEAILERLRWLDQVEFVRLEGARTNVSLLRSIFKLPNLKRLQLVDTLLSAKDLEAFESAPDLDHLEFIYNPLGDEAIEAISRIPVWDNLYLFGTKVTSSGERQLKEKMQGVDVLVARGGFLGVECPPTSVVLNGVVPGGAAELAKLQARDRIIRINGIAVMIFEDLRRELANFAEGESVEIEFSRRGAIFQTTAILQKRSEQARVR